MSFIHLHLHTEYSLLDGLIRIERLATRLSELNMPAVAVTEQGNLFSAVKFYQAMQRQGIKPIIGSELNVIHSEDEITQLVLLCQHIDGYQNLTKLITRSYTEGQHRGLPLVKCAWIKEHSDGLIAISCAEEGEFGKTLLSQEEAKVAAVLDKWCSIFPDRYYIELQRIGKKQQDHYISQAVYFADKFQIPVVATNNTRFIAPADYEAHEARVCIYQGYTLNDPRRPRNHTDQQYLRSCDEMQHLFLDLPEAIENTEKIAQRCSLEFQLGEKFLPYFPLAENETQDQRLIVDANNGLQRLIDEDEQLTETEAKRYFSRLKREIDVIADMGFSGYFLIVADFIHWAKESSIPVGPGRGSGAGSLVAYVLGITELDPLKYDLLFERFLNPERVSLPDFDVDFCMDRRDEVIDYVATKYGRDHVSQIITYGTMAAKAVVRDVGRILGFPYGFVDSIAKLIPFDLNMTLTKALDEEKTLKQRYEMEEDVKTLIDLAKKLEGLCRNASRHAGGVVIAPRPLTEYMPLYCEQGSQAIVSQFDMEDVESVGLVKFDFLGLRTLTIIDWTLRDVNRIRREQNSEPIAIRKIPLDDPATYQLIQRMDTTAVFQLESDGMKKLIKRLKPDVFDDLIALVALFRPGPLQSGMVADFIARKHGAHVKYMHNDLLPILKSTYGIILYQEQVMQIAQALAGYTLGTADLLRRAMGKKKLEEMAKQRAIFTTGAVSRGVNERQAVMIFNLMEKFAGYGFNKSHSAAYALIAYQTAWLKAHYPAAFMAAVLSSDMDNTDKVVMLREEVRRMNIEVVSPSVNQSQYRFMVINQHKICYGLGAIKGVGATAVEMIVNELKKNGTYKDLFDFCKRVDLRKANRRVLESLIRSGSMDQLGAGRSTLLHNLANAISLAEQHSQNNDSGQDDLFGLDSSSENSDASTGASLYDVIPEWSDKERLSNEKETLGFYLSGHPFSRYEQELSGIISRLHDIKNGSVRVAGYIMSIRRSGMRAEYEIKIDDNTARIVIVVNSDKYEKYRNYLIKDQLIIVSGMKKKDDYFDSGIKIIVNQLFSIDDIRQPDNKLNLACVLQLTLYASAEINVKLKKIKNILEQYRQPDSVAVTVHYIKKNAKGQVLFGKSWHVKLNDSLIDELIGILGKKQVKIDYNFRA